jgi:hypothetical protein
MALADAVSANWSDQVRSSIANLLIDKNPKNQFVLGKKTTREEKMATLVRQMEGSPVTATSHLKLLIHTAYPGAEGVALFVKELGSAEVANEFAETINSLDTNFLRGDLQTGAELGEGLRDVVHMVNAFGFNPINDEVQVRHLAAMLRQGGRLVITAELTGPTVSPLFGKINGAVSAEDLLGRLQDNFGATQLRRFFDLGPFVYPYGVPLKAGLRSAVMPNNAFTEGLETRHTMPSEDTTVMDDNPSAQVTFIRNAVRLD